MVRGDQPRPFQGIEQVPPFPSQDLEPSLLERLDLRNLDDDGSQLSNSCVTRRSQLPQSGRIFRRDMRLLQVIEDLLFLLDGIPVRLRHPSAVFADVGPMTLARELLVRSCSSADSAVVPYSVSFGCARLQVS